MLSQGKDLYHDSQNKQDCPKQDKGICPETKVDVVGIINEDGEVLSEYKYDAWGNIIEISGDIIGEINPIRYRSYYFDSETGFYYLGNRYYDPEIRRMINADHYISVAYPNLFSYAINNPIMYGDPSGNFVETVIDIASIAWSFVDLIKDPSWINLGFLAWDVGAVFVPFVPGSYTAKGGKKLIRVASKADDLKTAKYLTVGPYSKVKKLFKGAKSVESHHVIEKRFLKSGRFISKGKKITKGKMMAVPIDKKLHKVITARWKKAIPYGTNYKNVSKAQMRKAIGKVYKDMPAMKKYALKYLEETWK